MRYQFLLYSVLRITHPSGPNKPTKLNNQPNSLSVGRLISDVDGIKFYFNRIKFELAQWNSDMLTGKHDDNTGLLLDLGLIVPFQDRIKTKTKPVSGIGSKPADSCDPWPPFVHGLTLSAYV